VQGKPVKEALVRFFEIADTSIQFATLTNSSGEYELLITGIQTIEEPAQDFQLYQNYPNPFSETTTITYSMRQQTPVTVGIYDILGKMVKTFRQYPTQGSYNRLIWSGQNDHGEKVGSGIYFIRLTSEDGMKIKKMVYLSDRDLVAPFQRNQPLPKQFGWMEEKINHYSEIETHNANIGRIYKAYVQNTINTTPRIVPLVRDNIIIDRDTVVVDFQVHEFIQNRVKLENQLEHSGIMVKIVELDTFVITDSTGLFIFDNLPDGNYTLLARYPYFAPVQQNILIQDGVFQTPVNLQLKQQLQFWIEPAETTIVRQSQTNPHVFLFPGLRQYRVNVSDEPVTVNTFLEPNDFWALVPQDFDWPYVSNPDSLPDYCYGLYGWLGGTDIEGGRETTFQLGDTSFVIVPRLGDFLLKDCVKPGAYLFYSSISDLGHYLEYFDPAYVRYKGNPNQRLCDEMNRSLLKKRELFRPATIYIID